jgi:K+-sensing histidine kinase KdpD
MQQMKGTRHPGESRDLTIGAAGVGAMALVIVTLRTMQAVPDEAIAALLLLLVISITATAVRVSVAIAVSVIATAAFNFFLLPCPDGGAQFTILVPARVKETEPAGAAPAQ